MKHKHFKAILLTAILLALPGCSTLGLDSGDPGPSRTTQNVVDVDGDILSVVVSSEDYVELQTETAAEAAREECYKAAAAMPSDGTAQALREMRLMAGGKVDCGLGKYDAEVAIEEQKTERTKTRWGTGERIIGRGLIGGAAYGILKTVTDAAGNRISLDNGSTLEGNVGEGNTYSRQESRDGIPLNPADVNPVTLSGTADEEEEACTDIRPLIPIEEGSLQDVNGCFDINQDGLVCSTGGGCEDN